MDRRGVWGQIVSKPRLLPWVSCCIIIAGACGQQDDRRSGALVPDAGPRSSRGQADSAAPDAQVRSALKQSDVSELRRTEDQRIASSPSTCRINKCEISLISVATLSDSADPGVLSEMGQFSRNSQGLSGTLRIN